MILIADSGSTKTGWSLVTQGGGGKVERIDFETEGYNPCYVTAGYMAGSLSRSLPGGYDWSMVRQVGFYGAGCYGNMCHHIKDALGEIFPNAHIDVAMDLVAAARSLLGDEPGFAAILGTGTNSCIYDGREVVVNIDSLGFVLGDEGSGGYIGKNMLRDFIRGDMPGDAEALLEKEYPGLDAEYIIEQVYSKPMANRFCAGFCKFIEDNLNTGVYFRELIDSAFCDFFENIVSRYPGYKDCEFNCVGSVGYHFRDILSDVCRRYGMEPGVIRKTPLDGLVEYYMNKI